MKYLSMNCCAAAALDAELGCQPERAHAVNQSEVDGLDVAPLLRSHVGDRDAEDVGGGRAVNVLALRRRPAAATASPERCAMMRNSICE